MHDSWEVLPDIFLFRIIGVNDTYFIQTYEGYNHNGGRLHWFISGKRYRVLLAGRRKHFVKEQQVKAMKKRLEEAENFYGSIRKSKV